MNNSNEYLTLSRVPAYLKSKHGFEPTRSSINNWVKLGVAGNFLKVERRLGPDGKLPFRMVASITAIEDFVSAMPPMAISFR